MGGEAIGSSREGGNPSERHTDDLRGVPPLWTHLGGGSDVGFRILAYDTLMQSYE